MNFDTEQ